MFGTPTTTQNILIAWLSVAFVVAGTALTLTIRLCPQVSQLWDLAKAHEAGIKENQTAIVQLDHAVSDGAPVTDLVRDQATGGHD